MSFLFVLHILLFSGVAFIVASLPKQFRARYFYSYLTAILVFGGLLSNAYAIEVVEGTRILGGTFAYGAFMLTAVMFVLIERDVFVLRRLIFLVVSVMAFNTVLSILLTRTLDSPWTTNIYGMSPDLFVTDKAVMVISGAFFVVELAILLYVFELIKKVSDRPWIVGLGFTVSFIAMLVLDGLIFPVLSGELVSPAFRGLIGQIDGTIFVACAYGLVLLLFTVFYPKDFATYLHERVFSWPTLLSSSRRIIRDMSDKEHQLTLSEERIMQSASLAGLGYAVSDVATGAVVECDETFARMHGRTAAEFTGIDVGREIINGMVHPDDLEAALAARKRMLAGEHVVSEIRHIMPDGEVRSLRKIFSPLRLDAQGTQLYQVVGQDVTEARQLQDKLFQSQKMDAIGKLTGGVAHDFNNLLAVILGNLELLDDEITDLDHKELIRNSVAATMRGADLTRNLLSFARKAQLRPKVVDLNQLVENLQSWTKRTLPSTIAVQTRLEPALWKTKVDPTSAESGLLNLILNARDAMPSGGTLTIETANVLLRADDPVFDDGTPEPGRYVVLRVHDTGSGIAPENHEKIFEPFFTTKPVGAGSGLGLSMVAGFMQQSRGMVRVSSEEEVGTTFSLYFRAADDEIAAPDAPEPEAARKPQQRARHILLVEDSVEVLATIRSMLVKEGFRVSTAQSGDEAVKLAPLIGEIDLLLTDIVMPGLLQGGDLAAALRRDRPNLPVVMISGYFDAGSKAESGASADVHLMKPVKRDELLRAVAQALPVTSAP